MSGFLPLIEAFLAFALTMVALTTAVSVIAGFVFRFMRSRAYGLREMITYFYRTEILPLLDKLETAYAHNEQAIAGIGEFLDKRYHKKRNCRIEFIVDMTFLPTVFEGSVREREKIIEKTEGIDEENSWWKKYIDGLDKLAECTQRYARLLSYPLRWLCRLSYGWKRWRSLKYGLDTLPDEEFVTRLKASRLGKAFAAIFSNDEMNLYTKTLKERFSSLGAAYSEKFARKSRVLTIIVGFFLAFAANVDSLALIEAFMTNPEIRNQIIEQQEEILAQTALDIDQPSSTAADDRIKKLGETIGEKIGNIEKTLAVLPPGIKEKEEVKKFLAEVEKSKKEVKETFGEANETYNDIRMTVIAVTQTFPVGWSLYPNCDQSADPRCLHYKTQKQINNEMKAKDITTPEPPLLCFDFRFSFEKSTKDIPVLGWFAEILDGKGLILPDVDVCRLDSAQYLRWITGVILTGLLLGLGTPFWVQVVTSFLRARNLIRGSGAEGKKPDEKQKEGEAKTDGAKPQATRARLKADIPSTDISRRRRLLK